MRFSEDINNDLKRWDDELNDGTKHKLPEQRLRLFKKVFQESQK